MQPYSYGYEVPRPDPYAWLDTTPSDPLSPPGLRHDGPQELHSMCLSNANFAGILPQIPNFQLGYSYTWAGSDTTQGLLNLDYLIPKTVNRKDVLFGQVHGQFEDVSSLLGGSRDPNMQMLVGGGYRKRLGANAMIGLNGFYTTARLSRDWYSSGIAGLEMAWVSLRDAVFMLNCNYYGNIFADATGILTSYRGQTGDYKIEASYEQPILRRSVDFKVRGSSYRLDRGGDAYGWTAGAELTTRDRVLNLRYEVGHDRITDTYQSVGVYVTVGLRLERLFRFGSPFSAL
ncbi:MAG: inverse autotransporter beta domain-containing protein [Desulfomonile tiedjei]|nr:inverse autotransporter beta domain-containing protein [Desulfomonile tiedjei]